MNMTHTTRKNLGQVLRILLVTLCVIFFLFPIIWLLETSLKLKIDMFTLPPKWIGFTMTLKNFTYVLKTMPVLTWGKNSLLISLGTMTLSLVLGVPAGYAFSRVKFRGRFALLIFFLLARTLPPVTLALPFRVLMLNMGLFGTRLSVILIDTIYDATFTAWLMSGLFASIPEDLEEAAIIDGCTAFTAFFKVILPLSLPGLVTSALFAFIYSWNDFIFAMTLTSPKTATLPLGMLSTSGMLSVGWTYMAAMGVFAMLPVLLLSLFLQKYYVSGLTLGGVK
ncbi:carbohydrate ABC transporter permease [uncultured Sphaerochaeta sp.]|uniref:carbohydrate ABC transporter permease n=1 Tax=uncultured Sphaerochaeta sp. TaxID=886478 RepID=UPI002A0A5105|nr:carbohydrate ABC transporter permease [uncultured Sphaerochaeta sp.]